MIILNKGHQDKIVCTFHSIQIYLIIYLVLRDEEGQRFGDRWADTQVINDAAVGSEVDTVEVVSTKKVDKEEDIEV